MIYIYNIYVYLVVVYYTVARGHQSADTLKPYSQKTSQSNHTRTTALSNSMKLSTDLWGLSSRAGLGGEI